MRSPAPQDLRSSLALIPASPDLEPLLAQLLESYAREFSQFLPIEFNADGTFTYPDLPSYWRDPDKHPFLIHVSGEIAGFALIRGERPPTAEQPLWDVAEFFVTPPFRRHLAGTRAAHILWRKFPGRWQVRVLDSNQLGLRFWQKAIHNFTGEPGNVVSIEVNGNAWQVFSFTSAP